MTMTKRVIFSPLPRSVYVWWKILGLCPFVFDESEIIGYSRAGYFYTMVLLLAYTILYVRAVSNRIDFVLPRETSMTIVADVFGLSVEFFMIIESWLYTALRSDELRKILKKHENVCATAELIGIGQNYNKVVRRLKIHVILVNSIWFCLYCFDNVFLYENKSFKHDIWMPFNFLRIASHNIVIIFVNAFIVVKKYFYLLNRIIDKLSDGVTTLTTLPRKRQKSSRHWRLKSYAMPDPLEIYGQMHSDLVTLTERMTNFFSLSIILVQLVYIIQMASGLYILCMMTRASTRWITREIFAFGGLCAWFFFHLSQTVILLGIPDSTANEANRAGKLLHKMLTANNTKTYVDTGQLLSLRLLRRRLAISLWGLLEMRLSVVYTIIGTVGTYITVMMQLDSQNLQQDAMNTSIIESRRSSEAA